MENIMLDLIDDVLDVNEEEKEAWKVEDDLSADWCLDKIRESKAEYKRFEMVAKEKIKQIEDVLSKEKTKMENETSFFEAKLREYFEIIESQAKETKTMKNYILPSGKLKLTKARSTFDYNKNKLLKEAEAKKMNGYIKTKKDFDWAGFKKKLEIDGDLIINKETGEIVELEGLKIKTNPEKFNVEV